MLKSIEGPLTQINAHLHPTWRSRDPVPIDHLMQYQHPPPTEKWHNMAYRFRTRSFFSFSKTSSSF